MATTSKRRANGHSRQRSASTKAKTRSKSRPRRGATNGATKKATTTSKTAARTVAEKTKEAIPKPRPGKVTRKLAGKAAKKLARRTIDTGLELIRTAADRAAAAKPELADVVEKPASKRLPIQRSIDIAVPLQIAWEEWLTLESLLEGTHVVTDIERAGDELNGQISGPTNSDWSADILDQREQQSFAWRSREGSDCAGLVTFHQLSDRLTRLELNLDVIPTTIPEALQLATRLADRRAEVELRRFKARLELINPDVYEDELEAAEPEPDQNENDDQQEEDAA